MNKLHFSLPVVAGLLVVACGQKQESAEPAAAEPAAEQTVAERSSCTPQPVADVQPVELATGLTSRTLVEGCGDVASNGDIAVVHYTGWLYDEAATDKRGDKFDSSVDRGQHFKFPLGGGRVIKGWDQGVAGMAVGEVRELTIAPELAYGNRAIGSIPSGSTLVFQVELANLEGGPNAAQ